MWQKKHEKVYQNISRADIWRVWKDVKNWPQWDKDLSYCEISQPFAEGTQFILKPIDGPKVKITLSRVIECKQFTDFCCFPGAKMMDDHQLESIEQGVKITSTISVSGWLSFLWVKLVARKVACAVPQQMDALVAYARKQYE